MIQPPYNFETEAALLGCCLLDKQIAQDVSGTVVENDFYEAQHGAIYGAILKLLKANKIPDMVQVSDVLGDKVPISVLAELTNTAATPAWENYRDKVLDYSARREVIAKAREVAMLAQEGEEETGSIIERGLHELQTIQTRGSQKVENLGEGMIPVITAIREARQYQVPTGFKTGFTSLDEMTAGLQRGELYIIAARPGMGKTALGLNICVNLAVQGTPVGIFSLEMTARALRHRVLSSISRVAGNQIRTAQLSDTHMKQLDHAAQTVFNKPCWIADMPGASIQAIRAEARRMKRAHNISVFFVDYLQLLHDNHFKENRQQEVSAISRSLATMAKELDCAMVVASQLNRASEGRSDKKPVLSDLRESGAIEQDADLVAFIHREKYYDPSSEDESAEVIIAKQRSGPTGSLRLMFRAEHTLFEEV